MYLFRENFHVRDERERSYQIEIEENSALSCGHAKINDKGLYHITLNGNRHFLKTPRLRNFHLDVKAALTIHTMEFGAGVLIYFRYDRILGLGQVLRCWWDPDKRLHLFLNGKLFFKADTTHMPDVNDLSISLEVRNNSGTFSINDQQYEFDCPNLPELPVDGHVAVDSDFFPGGTMLISDITLQADQGPAKSKIGKTLLFPLKKVQGFSENLVYRVDLFRYESGETELECTLAGGITQRGERLESGGSEWGFEMNFLFSPYLRIETNDPQHREFCNFYFYNGEIRLFDPKAKPKFCAPQQWPMHTTLLFFNFPEKFTIAAGYERAFMRPWCYAENGPYEQIRDQNGELLYEGDSLRNGSAAIQVHSPADKKIASMIPQDIPNYEKALQHAQEQHYFFASENIVFDLDLYYPENVYAENEFLLQPALTDVFGNTLDAFELKFTPLGRKKAFDGIGRCQYRIELQKNPGNGVYHLQIQWAAGCRELPAVTVIFEVLSEDPEAPCPPLASRLPVMISMPNELKYIESDAFDPYSEVGGFAHYYCAVTRYAVPGKATQIWRLLELYRRKWMLMLTSRNSGDLDIDSERNAELMTKADYVDCHDLYYNGRYDLFNKAYYKKGQLGLLREFVATNAYPFKVLDEKKIADLLESGAAFPDEYYMDLVQTAWQPWCEFFAAKIEPEVQKFVDRILAYNPKLGRASYGPVPIYTSHYKSAYTLKYSGYRIEKDPRLRENGSFWFLEEYHYSCDYPLTRASYFVCSYDLYYDYGRMIYPEIYYAGYGCNDGAVYQAHPPFGFYTVPPKHQRRIVYQFTYGSPCFKNAAFKYWTDYGFHVRTPLPEDMREFVYAWGNMIQNEPQTPLKAPFLITDFDQFNRHGDYQETEYSFNIWDKYTLHDVCNTAEEALGWSYLELCSLGYNTPVLSKLSELDAIGVDQAQFIVLPPIVKGTPPEYLAAIRRAHQRGLNLLCFEDVCGLEDLFGVQERPDGPVPVRELPEEVFTHRMAVAKYENVNAEVLLWGASVPGGTRNLPIALLKKTDTGMTAFFNLPPTTVKRESFRQKYSHGQDTLSRQIKQTARRIYRELSGGDTAVWAERGAISACYAKNGAIIAVLSEDSPIYGDTTKYPVSFRFQISAPGIGLRQISADAPYSVLSREPDRLILRTITEKDTALFFKFTNAE